MTTEDREIELECVSENGKPAAEVQQQQQNILFRLYTINFRLRCELSGVVWCGVHVSKCLNV